MRTRLALALLLAGCTSSPAVTPDAGTDAGDTLDASDAAPAADVGTDAFAWSDAGMPRADYTTAGPHPVGNAHATITDRTGMRMLPVEVWYPADESARAAATTGQPMSAFEAGTAHESVLAMDVTSSPATCVRGTMHSALAPAAITTPAMLPAIVFSHCHGCMRYDVAEIAERLASHGIVVAAPDHVGDTLWDAPALPNIDAAELMVRASDVSSTLDALLDPTSTVLPMDLRGRIDATHVGVMGHSFGALTTGQVVSTDSRFVAALAIAAPLSALGTVRPADLHVPYAFLLAREDNSIGSLGNRLIRGDYAAVGGPAWLVEVDDAGHWSFSDIAGLAGNFLPGCGMGMRQDPPRDAFTYVDNAEARALGATVATAFFASTLLGDAAAVNAITGLTTSAHVSMHP
jgi:predicted dienelactone hydrolase